jgi:hypothetical protein
MLTCPSVEAAVDDHALAAENGSFQTSLPDQGYRSLAAPGGYEIVTDEEMIESLSFPSFRRVATMIIVPADPPRQSTTEMISISSVDLSDAQRIDRVRRMNDDPIDLDRHRGMAAQKATDIRRVVADIEVNAKLLCDHQSAVEIQLLAAPATSWAEAAAKARYVLNLYASELAPADTHHRDLVAAVLANFARLSDEG